MINLSFRYYNKVSLVKYLNVDTYWIEDVGDEMNLIGFLLKKRL